MQEVPVALGPKPVAQLVQVVLEEQVRQLGSMVLQATQTPPPSAPYPALQTQPPAPVTRFRAESQVVQVVVPVQLVHPGIRELQL